MDFEKYQHIERIGSVETDGINNGTCFIFPKIDGTNASVWIKDGEIQAGSRNRHLSLDNDNAGFLQWALSQQNILLFLQAHKDLRLYGEWLVRHTLRTYNDSAWNKFYVFDVVDNSGNYLPYDTYSKLLSEYEIEYIPPICKIINPSYERILGLLDKNTYLIKDGQGTGEGIVVKNYEYKNKFGRVTWGKVVKNEFKASHSKVQVTEIKEAKIIEKEIVDKFVTESLLNKEYSKIENEAGWSSKQIPRLLNTVYYCLVKEECWNIIKEFKNPTIDFKRLAYFTNSRIKELKPQLF